VREVTCSLHVRLDDSRTPFRPGRQSAQKASAERQLRDHEYERREGECIAMHTRAGVDRTSGGTGGAMPTPMELIGLEPMTSWVRSRRSPN
jgi:hypothetical protein